MHKCLFLYLSCLVFWVSFLSLSLLSNMNLGKILNHRFKCFLFSLSLWFLLAFLLHASYPTIHGYSVPFFSICSVCFLVYKDSGFMLHSSDKLSLFVFGLIFVWLTKELGNYLPLPLLIHHFFDLFIWLIYLFLFSLSFPLEGKLCENRIFVCGVHCSINICGMGTYEVHW